MIRRFPFAILLIGFITWPAASEEPEALSARKKAWQERLDRDPFRFPENYQGLLASIEGFSADCELHIIIPSARSEELMIKFERQDKELLALRSYRRSSVFRTSAERVYWAEYNPWASGCHVVAYDLNSGDVVWRTENLNPVPVPAGSCCGDTTTVAMWLSRTDEVPNEREHSAIVVSAHEGFADYMSVLDAETGTELARKVYRDRPYTWSELETSRAD